MRLCYYFLSVSVSGIGMTILYGILRGEIANITGSFKGQKYIIPSIMVQDVVNDTEARKKAEEEEFAGDAE